MEEHQQQNQVIPVPQTQNMQSNFQPSISNIQNQLSTKLNSSNYLLWMTQIQPILRSYGLIQHVDGTLSVPPAVLTDNSPNPALFEWYRND